MALVDLSPLFAAKRLVDKSSIPQVTGIAKEQNL